jgi:Kef-type K+ transport system membrane component KefB
VSSGSPDSAGFNRRRLWITYGLMLMAGVAAFLLIRAYGQTLSAPALQPSEARASRVSLAGDALFHVLLALATVIVAGWLIGYCFRAIGQPPVIGEVVAGIMLGPSFLGRVAPEAASFLLPESVAPYLGVVSQIGVILYMFLVGLELNPAILRRRADASIVTAHAGILLPFVLGAALALPLYTRYAMSGVPFTDFALFIGIALSITAFPVLARILTDRQMQKTPLGMVALTYAAIADVTAWCLLAFVVGVVHAKVGGALLVTALTLGYIGVMYLFIRPLAHRFLGIENNSGAARGTVASVLVMLLLSALITESIGVHAIFGAFLFGAILPHDSRLAHDLTSKMEDLVTVLLLPAFFAFTGMRANIGLVSGAGDWLVCGLIILVATAGKFGSTCLASRLTGLAWRESAALGILMNTRGLMELIVLNIGLELGILSPALFAMMVLMAIVTTMLTTPVLEWLRADNDLQALSSQFLHK